MKSQKLFAIAIVFFFSFAIIMACGNKKKAKKGINAAKEEIEKLDLTSGKKVYEAKCQVCHMPTGMGMEGTFPPLANSDFLLKDKIRALKTSLYGNKTPITVNGVEYKGGAMVVPGGLTNQEAVDVVNFILNSWGNKGGTVTLKDVAKAKE